MIRPALSGRLGRRGASGETDAWFFLIPAHLLQGETMRLSKKFAAIAITSTVALTASVAFAAWTASGSGSGYAKAGAASALTTDDVSATTVGDLFPSGTGDVKLTINNPNPYQVTVSAINNGASAIISSSTDCNTGGTGVTFANQTGLSYVVQANGELAITLLDAASMSNASDNACQGATFTIPVSLVGASSVTS
jgi:hypothetical protein